MGHLLAIHPGEFAADAIGNPDPGALVWFGYKAIALYWKDADAAKIARYHAAGLGVWLIQEWRADDADGGYQAGFAFGRQSRAAAEKVGYPPDVPMICANDKDTDPASLATHVAFQRGFDAGYAYAAGIYADRDVIDSIGAQYPLNWQCGSPWYSKLWWLGQWIYPNSQFAHFRQYGDKFGLGVDHNICLRECVAWLPNQPDPLEDDDMATIYKFSDADAILVTVPDPRAAGIVVQSAGSGKDPKVGPWLAGMQALGVKVQTTTVAGCAGLIFAGTEDCPKAAAMTGDSRHTWTGAEFKAELPAPTTSGGGGTGPTKVSGSLDLSAETFTGTLS